MSNLIPKIERINKIWTAIEGQDSIPAEVAKEFKTLRDEIYQHNKEDFSDFAAHFLWIINKKRERVNLKFHLPQRNLWRKIDSQYSKDKPVRINNPKYRQQGASTFTIAMMLWYVLHNADTHGVSITNAHKITTELSQRLRVMLKELPNWYPHKKTISENQEQIIFGNRSKIDFESAGNPDAGRGKTPNFFHASEVAFWQWDERIIQGALQGIPYNPNTFIIFESTGFGPRGTFYDYVKGATEGKNDYINNFDGWYKQEEYTRSDVPNDFELNKEEKQLKGDYKLTIGQLYWRRQKIAELGPQRFMQEYPIVIEEVFTSTSKSYFDPVSLGCIKDEEPYTKWHYVEFDHDIEENEHGELKIYETYDKKKAYRISVDTAEGVIGGDNTCFICLDNLGNTIFTYKGIIKPSHAIGMLSVMGEKYGDAEIHIEKTGLGIHFIETLHNYYDYDNITMDEKGNYCYRLSQEIRDEALALLKEQLTYGDIMVKSDTVKQEMLYFVRNNTTGKYAAARGKHDDEVITFAWAAWLHRKDPLDLPLIIKEDKIEPRDFYVKF